MEPTRRLALSVGLLVVVSTTLAFVIVVLLGRERLWFHQRVSYHASFADVAGLREGALVRLGGREVGTVTSIRFSSSGSRAQALIVRFRINADYAGRVRADSVARILSQGLLGDKLLDVTIGAPEEPRVPPGGWVRSEEPADLSQLFAVATEAATHARDILARFDEATREVGQPGSLADVSAAAGSLRRLLARVETGPGGLHDLIYSRALAANATTALKNLSEAAATATRVIGSIKIVGPAPDVLINASLAFQRVAELSQAVDAQALHRASRDVADIIAEVRAGHGSLGGLIVDPTVYEGLKGIVVSIRRNTILKGLARLLSSRARPEVPPPPPPPPPPPVRPRPGPRPHP